MPYYGDYYAGDPGLFSGIGKIFKGALGIASKVLPGPIGTIAGVANRLVGGGGGRGTPGALKTVGTALRSVTRRRRAAAPRARRGKRKGPKFGSPAWRRKYMRA